MPSTALLGTGYMPSGATGQQLEAVTRRAFVPSLVVQIYQSTPILSAALGAAQTASGGVSSVTVPIQGTSMTAAAYTDFSGAFDPPSTATGITDASFNLAALVVPIGFAGMEGLIQHNAAVIPVMAGRMNDAGNTAAALLATDLATNATNGTNKIDGLPLIAADSGTYGNIDARDTTNSFWAGNSYAAGVDTNTRATILKYIVGAMKFNGGEMPNIGVMGPGTWEKLAEDFVGIEQVQISPANSFPATTQQAGSPAGALVVAGVPIYMDVNFTEGELILFNTRYTSFYIHELAQFIFTGFASTIPNLTLGYIGVVVAALQFLCVKPKSVTRVTGLANTTLNA
jgi:hypothetical protein